MFSKGDRVFHKNLCEFGNVTMTGMEYAGDSTSMLVMFEGGEEKEVSTPLLIKIQNGCHEELLRQEWDA